MTPEPLDPKKYHTLSGKNKILITIIALGALLTLIPILGFIYYKAAILRPSQNTQETTLEIKGGESVSDIANKLYAQDLVNSEFLFKFYIVLNHLENDLQAGVYTIPGGTSTAEISMILQHGTNDKTITFLEGWRVEEFAKEASTIFDKIDYEEFVKIARNGEGELFPDTYIFSNDVTEEEMIDHLNKTFKIKTEDILDEQKLAQKKLTSNEVLIIASIVEREVTKEDDKRIVAGILINRLKNGELLGADATTQYVVAAHRYGCAPETTSVCPNAENVPDINWWPNDLTQKELDTQNAYNTRAMAGLPPAPISNPSLSTIEATVNYEDTDYYFYINDSDGTTHFAKTLDEHNANVQKYLR